MNELKIFESPEFGNVRIVNLDETVLFCASDVALALGYSNPRDAIYRHCKGVVKHDTPTKSGIQSISFIPEGDVYRLIVRSKLPTAEKFEKWLFDEIIPTIRKTGGYVGNDEMFVNNYLPFADDNTKALFKLTLQTIKQQNELIEKQNKKIEQDKPFVQFAAHVSNSDNAIDMETFSKILHDKNIRIGRNRLFELLKYNKYLTKFNLPYQKYVDAGYFKVVEVPYQIGNKKFIRAKTVITGKGQIYFFNKIKDLYDVDKIK